jgi:hypothetical protein
MDIVFYIAQGISILNGVVAVAMMQFKDMKKILIGQILANLLTASTYFLLGGLSGAGVCFIAIFQTVVMFIYSVKKIPPHRWVIIGFILLYAVCSAIYYKSPVDLLSAAAVITYAMSVVQTKPAASRLWYLFNPLLWLVYDLFTRAYGNFILHFIVFCSTAFAIWNNDLRKKSK